MEKKRLPEIETEQVRGTLTRTEKLDNQIEGTQNSAKMTGRTLYIHEGDDGTFITSQQRVFLDVPGCVKVLPSGAVRFYSCALADYVSIPEN